MAIEYFIRRAGEIQGPFEASAIRKLASSGEISPEDLIASDRSGPWIHAGKLSMLFPQAGGATRPRSVEPPSIASRRAETTGMPNRVPVPGASAVPSTNPGGTQPFVKPGRPHSAQIVVLVAAAAVTLLGGLGVAAFFGIRMLGWSGSTVTKLLGESSASALKQIQTEIPRLASAMKSGDLDGYTGSLRSIGSATEAIGTTLRSQPTNSQKVDAAIAAGAVEAVKGACSLEVLPLTGGQVWIAYQRLENADRSRVESTLTSVMGQICRFQDAVRLRTYLDSVAERRERLLAACESGDGKAMRSLLSTDLPVPALHDYNIGTDWSDQMVAALKDLREVIREPCPRVASTPTPEGEKSIEELRKRWVRESERMIDRLRSPTNGQPTSPTS